MKAVICKGVGGREVLDFGPLVLTSLGDYSVRVAVKATAVNRADILQREGKYPPPAGASPILGLEASGVIEEIGSKVTKWKVGDRVMGLLSGGGYATFADYDESMLMALPDELSFEEGAAIPEVFLTAYQALNWLGKVAPGENVLIHAGGSGVGTAAIQLVRSWGANPYITASLDKHAFCLELGAQGAFDRKSETMWNDIRQSIPLVNLILDVNGGSYFAENIKTLSMDGRMVMLAVMGGLKTMEATVGAIVFKRLQIMGSTLRSRSLEYQIALSAAFEAYARDKWKTKELRPIIDSIYSWKNIREAHERMESNQNIGKVVVVID